MSRKNIHPYLSDELIARFKKYCTVSKATESSVVEEALQRFFDDRYDVSLILRRLDRLDRTVKRVSRDVDIMAQTLAVFIQIWFAHTPKIDGDNKAAANALAQKRFADFTEYVSRSLSSGENFFDLLAQEPLADYDELAAAADITGGDNE